MELQNNSSVIKCHKCRQVLLCETNIVHKNISCDLKSCDNFDLKKFIYLQEDKVPPWIKTKIENEQWTKGKLHCQNCGSKVGSFDFISGKKCNCGKSLLPSIHFVTSQVDVPIPVINLWNKISSSMFDYHPYHHQTTMNSHHINITSRGVKSMTAFISSEF